MRSSLLCFAAGVCAFHLVPAVPPVAVVLVAVLLIAVLLRLAPLAAAAAIGFVLSWGAAAAVLDDRWPVARHGEDLIVTGTVTSLPDRAGRGGRVMFTPDAGQDPDLPRRIRIAWYVDDSPPEVGSRWRMALRMRAPVGTVNPLAFDYEAWLTARRIGATATVRILPSPEPLGSAAGPIARWRARVDAGLHAALGDHPRRPILRGLTLGERGEVDAAAWEVFARTGTAHLMAISGLHVGMVAAIVFWLGHRLVCRMPRSAGQAREIATLLALFAALLYALMAGFTVPTRRASCMLAAAALALCARREGPLFSAWTLALAAVTFTDPLAPLTIGFWLSFGAVAVIAWALHGRRGPWPAWLQLVRVQWAVALGLLPLTLWFFQRGSMVAPLANLLAVPAFSVVIVPGALAGAILGSVSEALAGPWLRAVAWCLDLLWAVLEVTAGWAWSMRFTPRPPPWTVVAALGGSLVLLLPKGLPLRGLVGACLIVPMLCFTPSPPPEGAWRLVLLDVGQGLAAVVQTHRHVLVYDTGPSFGPAADAGSRTVVPYLRAHGVRRLDLIVISHPHDDHDGGLHSLLAAFPGTPVLAGDAAPYPDASPCMEGMAWDRDGVRFRVLHPPAGFTGSANEISCVLEVSGPGGRLLLPGDVEWPAELLLARPGGPLQPVDVVVAPHHGSGTSSIPRFVQRTAPIHVLVPAGFGNRWGFPARVVVRRWEEVGAEVHVVGRSGALAIEADPREGLMGPVGERLRIRRWWRTLLSSMERGNE